MCASAQGSDCYDNILLLVSLFAVRLREVRFGDGGGEWEAFLERLFMRALVNLIKGWVKAATNRPAI